MRGQLGYGLLTIGTVASALGVATLATGLATGRRALLDIGRRYVAVILVAAVGGVRRDGDRALRPRLHAEVRQPTTSPAPRPGSTRSLPRGGRSRARSCCGRCCLSVYVAVVDMAVPESFRRPARRVGHAGAVRDPVVLLRPDALRGQPVQGATGLDPARRRGPEPATAEPSARRDPSTVPLRGLRRVRDPVLVRDRRADHRALRRRAGSRRCGARRSSRGASSPSASCSAHGGATRCSAGAASGVGIRSRTRRCCPGSPRPRSSIR